MPKTLRGVLHIHAETGTEGGWLAFMDGRHISTRLEIKCRKCGAWWDGDENEPDGDKRIGDYVMRSCKKGHHELGPAEVPSWGYAGLHMIEDRDFLTVSQKDHAYPEVVFTGEVRIKRTTDMGEFMRTVITNLPEETWMPWFRQEYPVILTRGAKP